MKAMGKFTGDLASDSMKSTLPCKDQNTDFRGFKTSVVRTGVSLTSRVFAQNAQDLSNENQNQCGLNQNTVVIFLYLLAIIISNSHKTLKWSLPQMIKTSNIMNSADK